MITGFFGFDSCRAAVASDGSSPVNGVGPDTVPSPPRSTGVSVTTPTSIVFGSAVPNVTTGVVSDTAQLMGTKDAKGTAIKGRRPLVMQTTAATTSLPTSLATTPCAFGAIPTAGSNGGINSFICGLRIKFTASSDATFAKANVPVLSVLTYNYATLNAPVPFLWYNPSTQTLYFGNNANSPSVAYPLALGTEAYIEFGVSTGNAATVWVNGIQMGTTATLGSYTSGICLGTGGFVSGATDWFRVSICDIYTMTNSGGTYTAMLGNAIVTPVAMDDVTANTFSILPEGSTVEEALDPSNAAYLEDTLAGATVSTSNSKAISAVSGSLIATSIGAAYASNGGPTRTVTLTGGMGTSSSASSTTSPSGGASGLALLPVEIAATQTIAANALTSTVTTSPA